MIGDVVTDPNATRSNRVATLQSGSGIVGANTRSVELLRLGDSVVGAYSKPLLGARVFSQNRDGQAPSKIERKLATFLLAKDLADEEALNLLNLITLIECDDSKRPFLSFPMALLSDRLAGCVGSNQRVTEHYSCCALVSCTLSPDLSAKSALIAMISLADQQSGDGDGRDADANDPGDGRDNALCAEEKRDQLTVLTLLGQLQPRRIMELVFPVWIGLRKLWTYFLGCSEGMPSTLLKLSGMQWLEMFRDFCPPNLPTLSISVLEVPAQVCFSS